MYPSINERDQWPLPEKGATPDLETAERLAIRIIMHHGGQLLKKEIENTVGKTRTLLRSTGEILTLAPKIYEMSECELGQIVPKMWGIIDKYDLVD